MPVGAMTAGTDLAETRVGQRVPMQCGGSRPYGSSVLILTSTRHAVRGLMLHFTASEPILVANVSSADAVHRCEKRWT
jgi:hypothetical protein